MDYKEESLKLHEKNGGKIEIVSKVPLDDKDDLSKAYTPGVAEPCLKIKENPENVYKYTSKKNMVAVVSDGSAVLGLGDIGAKASLPVMEGKAALFKKFANVDAFPIVVETRDIDEIVSIVKNISGSFGGVNLEDVGAPRCFELEKKLKAALDIPVFHDDQHGTAIIVAAGLINSFKLTDKSFEDSKIVILGAGAAGNATAKMLVKMGATNVIICDRKGAIYEGREGLDQSKEELAKITNPNEERGSVQEVIVEADVFIGVSRANLDSSFVQKMGTKPIVFSLANPTPEISPAEAKKGGAFIVATGRSDYPNQINNVLAFPGIFRGALDARAKDITDEMKIAAAEAIASSVEPTVDKIMPDPFEKNVPYRIAEAVKKIALKQSHLKLEDAHPQMSCPLE